MKTIGRVGFAALVAAGAMAIGSGQAAAEDVKIGTLTCMVDGGFGFLVGSSKKMTCTFKKAGSDMSETYHGKVKKFGVDIGVTQETTIVWAVFAPSRGVGAGSLAGTYAGVSAEATAGVGVGANVMVGGNNKTIQLQPVSVQAQTGLDIAAGIATMTLKYKE